jgi:Signal transduction histidine kinase
MSHEIRTPINAMLGISNMLKDKDFGSLNQNKLNLSNILLKAPTDYYFL